MQSPQPVTIKLSTELLPLTPDEFRAIVARLRRNARYFTNLVNMAAFSLNIPVPVFVLYTIFNAPVTLVWGAFSIVAAIVLIMLVFTSYARKEIKIEQHLVRYILNAYDPAMVGPILELQDAAAHPGHIYSGLEQPIKEAVTRLLPLLRTEDVESLNTHQRALLRSFLFPISHGESLLHTYTPQRALWILHLLEQIGDKRDLPDIERFLKNGTLREDARMTAARCAEAIRERMAREKGKDVLLRPERKPEALETLLRSLTTTMPDSPEQLLRASAEIDRKREA